MPTILPINSHKTIGTSSSLVYSVLRDQMPKLVVLCNTSANVISVSILDTTGEAVLYDGITLQSNGSFTWDISSTGTFQNKDLFIYAIASGASSNLGVSILN